MHEEAWIETGRAIAHPWLCDAYGHLNTRNYVAMFDDAATQFLVAFGLDQTNMTSASGALGLADVKIELQLRHEVKLGALVCIRSSVLRIGSSSMTCRHEMRAATDPALLHATMDAVTVRFDLTARKSVLIEPALRERLGRFLLDPPPAQ